MLRIHVPDNAEITLYTLSGLKILNRELRAGINVLNLNVPTGGYLVRVEINNQVYSRKILK
ncbi:hypothetical protein MASR2M117_15480 [Paludibacter sp.]